MTISFLRMRGMQVLRIFTSVNWFYRLILLVMLVWAIAGIITKSSQADNSLLVLGAHVLLISTWHWIRADFKFLQVHIEAYKKICLLEYFIVSIPLILGLSISFQPEFVAIYLLSISGLAYFVIPWKTSSKTAKKISFIPDRCFEWKSGLRKHFYLILFIWLAGLLFSFQMGVGLTAIFLIGLMAIGFFDYCEPLELLIAPQLDSKQYMLNKIKGLFLVSGILFSPLLIAFCLFYSDFWYIPIIEIAVLISYLFYAMVIKYAFYEPNSYSSKNKVLLSLGALVFVLPFLLPAIWVLSIRLYFKSVKKLNFYLHDFN